MGGGSAFKCVQCVVCVYEREQRMDGWMLPYVHAALGRLVYSTFPITYSLQPVDGQPEPEGAP